VLDASGTIVYSVTDPGSPLTVNGLTTATTYTIEITNDCLGNGCSVSTNSTTATTDANCTSAEGSFVITSDCANGTYGVDITITSMGSSSVFDVVDTNTGAVFFGGITAPNTYSVPPILPSATS